jgi:hypothetical protein
VVRSAAEQRLTTDLDRAASDSARLRIAESALAAFPEDIVVGRMAQDVIMKFKDDPVAFFKARAESGTSVAAHYLYGRAADDTVIAAEQAQWILKQHPAHFWGLMQAGEAEWSKAAPNLESVRQSFEQAIATDPSRPEGYLNLAFLFIDGNRWAEAKPVLEAGAVCDPQNKYIREQRLTTYAELRDAAAYFDLAKTAFSDKPLTLDLPRANAAGRVTSDDLKKRISVIEYWAYT